MTEDLGGLTEPTRPTDALKPPWGQSSRRVGSGLGTLHHALVGAGGVMALFGVFYALEQWAGIHFSITEKFLQRGWTPFVAMYLTLMSFSILSSKLIRVRARKEALSATFVPHDAPFDTPEDVESLLANIDSVARRVNDDVLGRRIRMAIEHFVATRNNKEVGDILRDESAEDFARLEDSYLLLRAFLWAIPILGFVGTVVGVGAAVGGFAGFLSGATEIEQIKDALGGVTSGLSVAFDTTFVALLLSLLVMMFMSAVEKLEFAQQREVDEYCQRNVLRRLPTERAKSSSESELMMGSFRHVVRELVPSQEVRQAEVESVMSRIDESAQKHWKAATVSLSTSIRDLDTTLKGLLQEAESGDSADRHELIEKTRQLLDRLPEGFDDSTGAVSERIRGHQKAIAESMGTQEAILIRSVGILTESGGALEGLLKNRVELERKLANEIGGTTLMQLLEQMRATLTSLEPAIRHLVEKPLNVDVHFLAGHTTSSVRPPEER